MFAKHPGISIDVSCATNFCRAFIFMPLFGDTCRHEGLFAMHVPTWSNMSKSKSL